MSAATAIDLALVLPLAGAALTPLFHRRPNARECCTLVIAGALFLTVVSLVPEVLAGQRPGRSLFEILPGLELAFEVEPLGLLFALVVVLSQSVVLSSQANRIRDLAQEVSLLKWRMRQLEGDGSQTDQSAARSEIGNGKPTSEQVASAPASGSQTPLTNCDPLVDPPGVVLPKGLVVVYATHPSASYRRCAETRPRFASPSSQSTSESMVSERLHRSAGQ